MSNNGPRFQARRGADGHGCCYDAHVVDNAHDNATVCECDDIETAILIADALNSLAMVR